MLRAHRAIALVGLFSSMLLAGTVHAFAALFELEAAAGGRFVFGRRDQTVLFDPAANRFAPATYLSPAGSVLFPEVLVSGGAELELWTWLEAGIRIDPGALRYEPGHFDGTTRTTYEFTAAGQPIWTEMQQSFFLREIYLTFVAPQTGWANVSVGRRRSVIAQGLVFDDFALNACARFDLGLLGIAPTRIEARILFPGREWGAPLFSHQIGLLAVDYLPSPFEQIGLFAVISHDKNSAELFVRQSLLESVLGGVSDRVELQRALALVYGAPLATAGLYTYLGVDVRWIVGPGLLTLAGVFQYGKLELDTPLRAAPWVTITAGALNAEYALPLGESVTLSAFFLFLSGDERLRLAQQRPTDTYHGFVAVAPAMPHLLLFFSGGLDQGFASPRVAASGLAGHGVASPGLQADLIYEDLKASATVGYLQGLARGLDAPYGGASSVYGLEIDLLAQYAFTSTWGVLLESGIFIPFSYFADRTPWLQVRLAATCALEW